MTGKVVWLLTIGCTFVLSLTKDSVAQEASSKGRFETSILDEEPFDIITLTPEWKSEEVRVFPIEFPKGVMPTQPAPDSELEVRLVIFPDRIYRVAWKDIAKIERYENLVLGEAKRLLAARQFAAAFEHLNFLIENYPKTPNLDGIRQEFLLTSSFEAYRSGSLAQAFAALEEFVRKYPESRLINQARGKLSEWAGKIIEDYFNKGDFETARLMVDRLARDYRDPPMPAVDLWRKKFIDYAETYREKAIKLQKEGNFSESRKMATQMLKIAPEIPEGKSLLRELILAYPMVRVGVFQQSARMDVTELADWPVRRSGALVSQPLFEFRNSGPEGGSYRMTLGSFVHTDDRTELELRLKNLQPGQPTAYELSQWMMRRANIADPSYHASWAAILKQVKVDSPDKLLIQFKRPHVLPHAFLQWPIEALQSDLIQASTLYSPSEDRNARRQSFRWKSSQKPAEGQPVEIVESLYTDPKQAIADLIKGEIEVVDRLFPADAAQLRNIREIRVESYALPVVHMLVPKSQHPFVKDRDFRRALLYAVNRQAILNGEVLGGISRNDSQLLSGPFPIGVDENDPLAYAYNKDIQPIAYDPKLAELLVILTKQKLTAIANRSKEPLPELTPIRLGVPDYESARVAGEAFIQQWKIVGIPGELVILSSDPKEKNIEIDLLYLSASLGEPATDAERLFGEGGLAESDNIFIVQVLSNLRTANNWREVRQFCQDLHALVSTHLPVLPLWQVGESFAYRNILKGIPKKPVVLYQDIDRWRMSVPDFDR